MRRIAAELAAGGAFTLPESNLTYEAALERAPELGLSERNIDLAGHDPEVVDTCLWLFREQNYQFTL